MRPSYLTAVALSATLILPKARRSILESALPCLSSGSVGQIRLQDIKENLASSDTESVLWRRGFGLTGVDSASVFVVTDTLVCTRVTHAVDSAFSQPAAMNQYLLVLKAGPRYIAFDEAGYGTNFVDTTFTYRQLSLP
jgi:hypothetical protein